MSAKRKTPLDQLDIAHEVILEHLDQIVAGRFDGREALLKGQSKLIASGLRENLEIAKRLEAEELA